MARTLTVSLDDGPDAVVFPVACPGCGATPTTTSTLAFSKLVANARGTQRSVQARLAVPHCDGCARSTKQVFLAGLIPFALGFLAAGGAAFAVVALGAMRAGIDDIGRPNNANSLVLGAAAGLAAGIAGGFVFELVARALLLPVMGAALWRAPLLVPSFVTDGDYVAGVTGRPNADLTAVTLTFARDDVAAAFAAANASRLA